ncbi:MAG: CAP domain-containing protein [Fimbriimonas sp.]
MKLIVGACALLPALASADTFKVFTGSFGPRNDLMVSKPIFKWEIWPTEGKANATDIDFRIDGKPVAATYDAPQKAVVYTPANALSNGTHQVDVAVTFDGVYKFNKSWTATVSTVSLATLPTATSAQVEIASRVNEIRQSIGLPPVQIDNRLNVAAFKHSEYLTMNGMMGHNQVPGTKGFFGQTHQDRLAVYGWAGGAWEGVTYGSESIGQGVQQLFDAPYHRLPFLQPGSISFGSGFVGTRMTMEFGGSSKGGTVVSPANGEANVPTKWKNAESPNPMRLHGGQTQTGYPIVLARFSDNVRKIKIAQATLTLDGAAVPVFLNTPENDDRLEFAAIMFPQKALKAKASYMATFKGSDNLGNPIEVTSTFKTAG